MTNSRFIVGYATWKQKHKYSISSEWELLKPFLSCSLSTIKEYQLLLFSTGLLSERRLTTSSADLKIDLLSSLNP